MATPVETAALAYLADRKMNGAAAKTLTKFRPILALFADWARDRPPGAITGAELRLGWMPTWHAAFGVRNGRPSADRTDLRTSVSKPLT